MRYVSRIKLSGKNVFRFDADKDYLSVLFNRRLKGECIITITDSDTHSRESFVFSDYARYEDFKSAFNNLVNSGVVGIEPYGDFICVYALPKEALALRGIIDFVGDSSDIPMELISVNSKFYYYYATAPANKIVTDRGTILFSGTGCAEKGLFYDDVCVPESLILSYLKEFGILDENMRRYDIEHIHLWNMNLISDKEDYLDYQGMEDFVFRLQRDAIFQALKYPLYISSDGEIYLGYTIEYPNKDGLKGVLKYKIKDLAKFKNIVSKAFLLKHKSTKKILRHKPLLTRCFGVPYGLGIDSLSKLVR